MKRGGSANSQSRASQRTKPIEAVEIGDMVWAWDESTGACVARRVNRLYRNTGKQTVSVILTSDSGGRQEIEATTEHPFWVDSRGGWVAANELREGDCVKSIGDSRFHVDSVAQTGRQADVFNFEVDIAHNYFVGAAGVLVHNASDNPDRKGSADQQLKRFISRVRGMFALDKSLKSGEVPTVGYSTKPDFSGGAHPIDTLTGAMRARGVELGFQTGTESFTSAWAMLLLPDSTRVAALGERLDACAAPRAEGTGRYKFFLNENKFQADTDTTAIVALALLKHGYISEGEFVQSALEIVKSAAPESGLTEDGPIHKGVAKVYWDDTNPAEVPHRGSKHDATAAANVLYALELARRIAPNEIASAGGDEVIQRTREYVENHLKSGDYLKGTRYYPSPDAFLFSASRLVSDFPGYESSLGQSLRDALETRNQSLGAPGTVDDPLHPLNLSFRVLAAENLSMGSVLDMQVKLAELQRSDRKWAAGPFYTLGRDGKLFFGSADKSTVMVLAALKRFSAGRRSQ